MEENKTSVENGLNQEQQTKAYYEALKKVEKEKSKKRKKWILIILAVIIVFNPVTLYLGKAAIITMIGTAEMKNIFYDAFEENSGSDDAFSIAFNELKCASGEIHEKRNAAHDIGKVLLKDGEYDHAVLMFNYCINNGSESNEYVAKLLRKEAIKLIEDETIDDALLLIGKADEYYFEEDEKLRKKLDKYYEDKFDEAIRLKEEGDYADAIKIFSNIKNNEEAQAQLEEIKTKSLKNAKVGDTVYLGSYEQDGIEANGTETIEWTVLATENGKALLLSKNIIDYEEYNSNAKEVTWYLSSVRYSLSNFYEKAFTEKESALIIESDIVNKEDEDDEIHNSEDHIFLLNRAEVKKYLPDEELRKAETTNYVKAKAAESTEGDCSLSWWLRTSEDSTVAQDLQELFDYKPVFYPYYVNENGNISRKGVLANDHPAGVRPAMWVTIPE